MQYPRYLRQLLPVFALALPLLLPAVAGAAGASENALTGEQKPVVVDGLTFAGWGEYFNSEYFKAAGKRCGTRFVPVDTIEGVPADCSFSTTNPDPSYEPAQTYQIHVVTHIIENNDGSEGNIAEDLVYAQMDVLNEDFQGIDGTNGAPGHNSRFRFVLADEDPSGNYTNGITRSRNTTWFNDGGAYYNTLAWDTNRFMNFYTNEAGGNLGYVPSLPQSGLAGTAADRLVILWTTFGRPAPFVPFHLGRTGTHEAGHYFGLAHTFQNGCGTATVPSCYSNGDWICDTNPESSPTFGCPGSRTSCSLPAPFDNYMDYSDDPCMMKFTQEQVRRMVCSIQNYRPALYTPVEPDRVKEIGFETGNLSEFTSTLGSGDLSVTMAAGIENDWGMQTVVDDDERLYGQDESLGTQNRVRLRFWLDPNNLTMDDNKRFRILQVFSTTPDNFRLATLVLRYNAGDYFLRAKVHQDDSTWVQIPWAEIGNEPTLVEIDWQRSSGPGANNGYLRLWLNRRPAGEAADVDNDGRAANMTRLGVVGNITLDDNAAGTLYFDGYEVRRTLYIGHYQDRGAPTP